MTEVTFSKEKNQIVITGFEIDSMTQKIYVDSRLVREALLPYIGEKEQIEELEMMLHELGKHKMLNMAEFLRRMFEIEKKIESAGKKLEDAESMLEVKKWQAVSKAYVDQKNTLKELRFVHGLLTREGKALRTRRARLEAGHGTE